MKVHQLILLKFQRKIILKFQLKILPYLFKFISVLFPKLNELKEIISIILMQLKILPNTWLYTRASYFFITNLKFFKKCIDLNDTCRKMSIIIFFSNNYCFFFKNSANFLIYPLSSSNELIIICD